MSRFDKDVRGWNFKPRPRRASDFHPRLSPQQHLNAPTFDQVADQLREPCPLKMASFKAPAWAQSSALSDSEESDRDLFSHSKNYLAIQKESVEQRKRKEAEKKQKEADREKRRQEKAEKRDSEKGVKRESTEADEKGSLKKRRINSSETAKLLALAGVKPISLDDSDEDETIQYEPAKLPVRRSPRNQRTTDVLGRSRQTGPLDVAAADDSVGESGINAIASRPALPPPPSEEEEDSDPEIAALQRKAQAQSKSKLQRKSSTPGSASLGRDHSTGLPTPPPPDPVISILIDSPIPDTRPLNVKRKISQDLKVVRVAWCSKQGFSKEFAETIFLTWCNKKLYDFTTCQRLGLEVDSMGNVIRADERDDDGAAKVHLVAMTEELLAEAKAEKSRNARLETGGLDGEQEAEAIPIPEEEEQPAESNMIKLVVKAKGKPEFKLKLKPVSFRHRPSWAQAYDINSEYFNIQAPQGREEIIRRVK